MMIDPIIEMNAYPDKHSRCEQCVNYIQDRKCWMMDYIPTYMWNNYIDPKEFNCEYFKLKIPNQCNNCYIHRDYEDDELFPEKKFGGIYRFNSKGEIIGKL